LADNPSRLEVFSGGLGRLTEPRKQWGSGVPLPPVDSSLRSTNQEVAGSSPAGRAKSSWSIPDAWVTVHSGGDIGNTFGPNGFSIGSTRMASSSKYPKSYCIKLTSHTRSPTCVTPTFLSREDVAEIHLPTLEADPPAMRESDRLIVERVGEVLEPAIDAR
jgi:hypothetical protein